jgi:succinyl-diaminopimelate desuccinylase
MKYAIASYVALLRELGPRLANYNLGLLLTSDEELGGENGVGWLVNDRGYRGESVLLPDSSTPWAFAVGGKGIMRWDVVAEGRSAHSSRPWQGINAIDEVVRFTNVLRSHAPAEPCGSDEHRHHTVNLSTLSGGAAINQVPGSAHATIDIRYTPDGSEDLITGWITEALAQVPTVTATKVLSAPPHQVSPSSPAAKRFKACVSETLGHDTPDHMPHGSSDGRWFSWKGITDINIGITGSGYHTSPEWIEIADLTRFHEVVRCFVGHWAKAK